MSGTVCFQGIDFNDKGVVLISSLIADGLGIECSVLMGANVATEVAQDQFCEATIGCKDRAHGEMYVKLFSSKTFLCSVVTDTVGELAVPSSWHLKSVGFIELARVCVVVSCRQGVELCGALKNIVALAAGFSDGLGYGGNTKVC
jgi:glycerol-3-phosphate dehydrogenase (NAD+)